MKGIVLAGGSGTRLNYCACTGYGSWFVLYY